MGFTLTPLLFSLLLLVIGVVLAVFVNDFAWLVLAISAWVFVLDIEFKFSANRSTINISIMSAEKKGGV